MLNPMDSNASQGSPISGLDREEAIFNAAKSLPASDRAAYLSAACGQDAALRQRIEQLLESHTKAADFLEPAPPGPGVRATIVLAPPPSEKAGDRIGRYKLFANSSAKAAAAWSMSPNKPNPSAAASRSK